jgi:MATE family multidrug resistance protein
MFNHRQIWQLALPMIISNISTPLLGLVDTAVMGHLASPQFLGGVAVGGIIFSFIYWGFAFLRMGTTGLTAQAFGKNDSIEISAILARALLLGGMIAFLILLVQKPLALTGFWIIQSSQNIEQLGIDYFNIRIWSAPATLCLYVISGWFLGLQNVKVPVAIVVTTNLCNIALDLLFVVYFQLAIQGVALASVISEYLGLLVGLVLLAKKWRSFSEKPCWADIFHINKLKAMLLVNHNLFIRTLCLIFAFVFFTSQSARFGELILAANTVLLNFQMFMAYAMDGFANAAEALTGRAIGSKNKNLLKHSILTAGTWSLAFAITFSMSYYFLGQLIINLLTDLEPVQKKAAEFLPWLVILPLASFISFVLDGIFIGATFSRAMRNTMLFSLICCFFPVWYFSLPLQNHGLWLSLTAFMLARSFSMLLVFGFKFKSLF